MTEGASGPKARFTRVAAYGLVVQDSRILLCRISSMVPRQTGIWTLPGGGIDHGEDPKDAAVREVFEETGLDVRVRELLDVHSQVVELPDGLYHAIRIIYSVEVLGGELTSELDGSTDLAAWHTREDALRLRLGDLARLGIELAFDR